MYFQTHRQTSTSTGPTSSVTVPIPEASDEEEDMLAYAIGRKEGDTDPEGLESRLGCQIKVSQELSEWIRDGGKIVLPRY